jgi:hypothetical protein
MQAVKWRLHRRSPELVVTDAEGVLHCSFTYVEGSVQTHIHTHTKAISQRSSMYEYFPNLYIIVETGVNCFRN